MSAFSRQDAEQLQATLLDAVIRCSDRCLYQSAKWAAELASSFRLDSEVSSGSETDPDSPMEDAGLPSPPLPSAVSVNRDQAEARLEANELPKYYLAKSYFDCREYDRCAAVFLPSDLRKGPLCASSPSATKPSPLKFEKGKSKELGVNTTPGTIPLRNTLPRLSQKALFLALYAKYMAGEKRKNEESEMVLGPADMGSTPNRELVSIARDLEGWFSGRKPDQASGGWLEYLYGIVLAKGKNDEEGKKWLLKSINIYQYNWGAWLELGGLIGSVEEHRQLISDLPENIMSLFFNVHINQELHHDIEQTFTVLNDLLQIFPRSQFLRAEGAMLHYHARDFDKADTIFSQILHVDPHRIDWLDEYSNILFVQSNRPKLAFLAQLATATDKFRPETCCVVGNYYALKSEHEKSVLYFRRALTLDRNCLSAWILMGHEYVELKNTHAAIESYRRAVDINRKDDRAWYGLGQAYEVLEMYLYALFYYQRAASLRPLNPKMWQAVASCYSKVGRLKQSIKAYKRALRAGSFCETGSSFASSMSNVEPSTGSMDVETLYQIALLYERLDDTNQAEAYMELTIAQEESQDGDDADESSKRLGAGPTATTSKARLWLAYHEIHLGGFKRARILAEELLQDAMEIEEAKALIRDLEARDESEKM